MIVGGEVHFFFRGCSCCDSRKKCRRDRCRTAAVERTRWRPIRSTSLRRPPTTYVSRSVPRAPPAQRPSPAPTALATTRLHRSLGSLGGDSPTFPASSLLRHSVLPNSLCLMWHFVSYYGSFRRRNALPSPGVSANWDGSWGLPAPPSVRRMPPNPASGAESKDETALTRQVYSHEKTSSSGSNSTDFG